MKTILFTFLLCILSVQISNSQWVQTSNGMGNTIVYSLVTSGNYLFAGTRTNPVGTGVYMSTNNGINWTQTSLNNRDVWSLAIMGNNIIAATWGFGIYFSTNNGVNWTQSSLGNGFRVSSLAVNSNYVFAGTDFYGVYLSTNNGVNWSQTSLGNRWVYSLAGGGNYVYAGISDSGIYVSLTLFLKAS